jgi:peptidoglycan hydrolase-like protein with peptidoglycan-binding domain
MCGTPAGDVTAQDTQAMAAVSAGQGAAGYGAEPTQVVGMPLPPTQPPSEFDSLFRTPDGGPGLHGQTQLLPPVVATDYRMQPPGGTPFPPGSGEEEPRTNRPVVLATIGAVVVAAGVILGLLYLGNQGNTGSTASGATTAASTSASASQAPNVISVPTQSASPTPTAASSSAATTSAAFSGDSLPLGPGSQGSLVKWVQQKLKQLGYYHDDVTGTYDQATALAVQQFQAAAGVTGDAASTVGEHTRLALEAAGSKPGLRYDQRNQDVSRLNQSLDLAEGASLSGSRYTIQTAEAVAFYQQSVGLQPTGQMDGATWTKLQTGTLAGATYGGSYGGLTGMGN